MKASILNLNELLQPGRLVGYLYKGVRSPVTTVFSGLGGFSGFRVLGVGFRILGVLGY